MRYEVSYKTVSDTRNIVTDT